MLGMINKGVHVNCHNVLLHRPGTQTYKIRVELCIETPKLGDNIGSSVLPSLRITVECSFHVACEPDHHLPD